MANVKERLAALEEYLKGLQPETTVFLLEDGREFHTTMGVIEYLYKHGTMTPLGKHIVLYPHPVEGVDKLSLSLYQMIDQAIERGEFGFPDFQSDDVTGT